MATRLVSLKIAHVAGVDRPANKRPFLVVKQEKTSKVMSISKEGDKFCLYNGDQKMGEYDSMEAAQAAKSKMSKGATMLTIEQIGKIADKELQEAVVAQQEEMLVLQRQLEDAKKNGVEKSANLDDENIWKGISPALRNRVEEIKKERDKAAQDAKDAKDATEISAWVTKCQGFKYLHITPEHFGKVMKAVAEHCPTEANEIHRVLGEADGLIDKGHVFSEYGRAAGETRSYDATNVEARVDAMADDLVKMDRSGKTTYETALQTVFKQNPDLHKLWKRQSQVKVSAQ